MSRIRRPFHQGFMASLERGPASMVADQRADDHAPALPQRLQHDAGHAEYAIVIVRAEREKGLGHQGPSYTILRLRETQGNQNDRMASNLNRNGANLHQLPAYGRGRPRRAIVRASGEALP